MTTLSVLIPAVHGEAEDLAGLVSGFVSHDLANTELVIGVDAGNVPKRPLGDYPYVKLVPADTAALSQQALWADLISTSAGRWLTLINPADAIEPALARMVDFVAKADSGIDALAWSQIEIDPADRPEFRQSIALPTGHQILTLEKAAMLRAFFMWEKSGSAPKMPFGLYHGAIRRDLAMKVLATLDASGRSSAAPRYEWAGRAIMAANRLAFSDRPMSAINKTAFSPDLRASQSPGFPLHGGLGVTAAIAEVQHAIFAEMRAVWGQGAEENVIRAAMIDCMGETDRDIFETKAAAYRDALNAWKPLFAGQFQPVFASAGRRETRQGLVDSTLFVNRFIGNARDAHSFYRAIRSILTPVARICA